MNKLDSAKKVMKQLSAHGYEAYIVGGYVRDLFTKEDNNDIDI